MVPGIATAPPISSSPTISHRGCRHVKGQRPPSAHFCAASNSTSPQSTPVGLNMVECEISVVQRQCLGRRINDPKASETRSQHGGTAGIEPEPASGGSSQQTKLAPASIRHRRG
jgi:hypothetical protein